jgi:hypothetical protein
MIGDGMYCTHGSRMYLTNVALEPSHRSQGLVFESTRHLVAMVESLSMTNNIQGSYCRSVMIAFGYIPNWLVPGKAIVPTEYISVCITDIVNKTPL